MVQLKELGLVSDSVSLYCVFLFIPELVMFSSIVGPQFLNNQVSAAGGALDCTILPSLKL